MGVAIRSASRRLMALLLLPILVARGGELSAADRIVLRDLRIITDRTVTSLDADGLRLDDGRQLRWDEVEQARLAPDRQAQFDHLRQQLGDHLFRIRQRLAVGDDAGALPLAEEIRASYEGSQSDSAYLVWQALMWGYLANQQRELALESYLRCYTILRGRQTTRIELPGGRTLAFDPATGLAQQLPLIWFDAAAAAAVLPRLRAAIAAMSSPRPEGVYLYFASLALAAGEPDQAARVLGALQPQNGPASELFTTLLAQCDAARGAEGATLQHLEADYQNYSPPAAALAMYWLGKRRLSQGDAAQRDAALLLLLRVPAEYGPAQPELAAAALLDVMGTLESTGNLTGSIAVRRELLDQYGGTYAARQVRSAQSPK